MIPSYWLKRNLSLGNIVKRLPDTMNSVFGSVLLTLLPLP